jgi:hypothetical protein
MTPKEQKLAIARLSKWLLHQFDGITVALDAQLGSMDRFEITVQEVDNPNFKAKQYVFRLQVK